MTPRRVDPSFGDLVALDPSVRSAGVAIFRSGVLLKAKRVTNPANRYGVEERDGLWSVVDADGTEFETLGLEADARRRCAELEDDEEDRGTRCMRMAMRIATLIGDCKAVPRVLVFEWPQIYRAAKAKGDPNDLPGLAGVGMALAGLLVPALAVQNRTVTIIAPTPAEWIGQLPKATKGDPWASPRAERIASRMSAAERRAVPASHDVIDAAGIGLWALGRLDARRVFPGASSP